MAATWRVAIASLDGKFISEHFGRAKEFLIVDIKEDGGYTFVERRAVSPLCVEGNHSEEGIHNIAAALSDCTAVLVAKIGAVAKRGLESQRISVFEQPAYIADAIPKLAAYYKRIKFTIPEDD